MAVVCPLMPNSLRRRRLGITAPFTPPQWASLQLWLSADSGTFTDTALTTPAGTDGTAVGGWRDRGPFGHDATQATGARQPVLKTSGLNGHSTVRFTSASSQWLGADGTAAAFSGSNLPCTVMAVVQLAATGSAMNIYALGNSGVAAPHWFFDAGSSSLWASDKHDDTTHATTVTGAGADTNPHIVSWISPGTTMTINVDGVNNPLAAAQTQSPTTLNTGTVGALSSNAAQSIFLNGHIAEIFVWNTVLSAGEQAYVRAAMAKKYSVSST